MQLQLGRFIWAVNSGDCSCRLICSDACEDFVTRSLAVAKPIILRTTYGLAAEPNRRNFHNWNSMVTWPCCLWLFQMWKLWLFVFLLCVVSK